MGNLQIVNINDYYLVFHQKIYQSINPLSLFFFTTSFFWQRDEPTLDTTNYWDYVFIDIDMDKI
jgi:hypothetical protein